MSCDFCFLRFNPKILFLKTVLYHIIHCCFYYENIDEKFILFDNLLQDPSRGKFFIRLQVHPSNMNIQNASAARYSFLHHHYSIRAPRPNSSTREVTSTTTRIGIPTIGEYRVTPLLEFGQFFTNDIQI